MKPKTHLFLLCFLLIPSTILAQSQEKLTISLHKAQMLNTLRNGRLLGRPVDASKFKFDSSGYSVFYVCETSLLARKDTGKMRLHYLIGQKEKDELLVTIDENFNNSFLDDTVRSINLSGCNDCVIATLENCVTLNLKKISHDYTDNITLHIVPPCCFKHFLRKSNNRFIDTSNIALEQPFEQVGALSLAGASYRIAVRNQWPRVNYTDNYNIQIGIADVKDPQNMQTYSPTDTMRIGGKFYAIRSISKKADTINIERLPGEVQTGYRVGFYPYDIHEKNISTNQFINIADFKGDYVLLEFWGTWCGPCVGLHDDIVRLLETHHQIMYIGVAWDKDQDRVKKYISTSPALQTQLFAKLDSNTPSIVQLFRVSDFPTFILIGKNEQIVFRDAGTSGFSNLLGFLKDK